MVSPETDSPSWDDHADGTAALPSEIILSNTFIAASENGIILSEGNSAIDAYAPWTCSVPGGRATLTWD